MIKIKFLHSVLERMYFSFYFLRSFFLSKKAQSTLKRISFISFLSLLISFSAFIVVISIMSDLNLKVRKRLLTHEPHIVVTGLKNHEDAYQLLDQLKQKSGYQESYYLEKQDVILFNWKGQFQGAVMMGIPLERLSSFIERTTLHHSAIEPGSLSEQGVLIGRELSEYITALPGDQIRFLPLEALVTSQADVPKFFELAVKGYVTFTSETWDRSMVIYALENKKNMRLSPSGLTRMIYLWVDDPYQVHDFRSLVLASHPQLTIETWQEREQSMFLALKLEKFIITAFLTIAALVALFSVIMTVALFISQKTKDFILMRLLGMATQNLRSVVLYVSLLLSGMGIIAGTLLGGFIAYYLEKNPLRILPDIYYENDLSAQLNPSVMWVVIVTGIGTVYLVTRKIVNLLPTKQLSIHLRE